MSMINRISRAVDALLNVVVAISALALIIVLFIQVVNRYVFGFSWPVLQFLIPLFFVWLSMLGSAIAVRRRLHFEVDFLSSHLSAGGRRVYGALIGFAGFLAGVVFVWTGLGFAELGFLKLDPAIGVKMIYVYAALLIGGFFICLFSLEQILRWSLGDAPAGGEALQ